MGLLVGGFKHLEKYESQWEGLYTGWLDTLHVTIVILVGGIPTPLKIEAQAKPF